MAPGDSETRDHHGEELTESTCVRTADASPAERREEEGSDDRGAEDGQGVEGRRPERVPTSMWTDRVQALAAVVSAAVAIGILVVTSVYTWYARQQAEIMQRTLDESAETFKRDQRAWIGVTSMDVKPSEGKSRRIRVGFLFQNLGKTPATNVVVKTGLGLSLGPPSEPPQTPMDMQMSRVLFAGVPAAGSSAYEEFDEDDLATYEAGVTNLYVRVRIVYRDVFGRDHATNACLYHPYRAKRDVFLSCDVGNEIY